MKETDFITNFPLAQSGFVINGLYKVLPGNNEFQILDGTSHFPVKTISLEPRIVRLLVLLASECGETLSRDKLLKEVWDVNYVSDEALTHAISKLRSIFGESASNPKIIHTISRRGYRMVAELTLIKPSPNSESVSNQSATVVSTSKPISRVKSILSSRAFKISAISPAIFLFCWFLFGNFDDHTLSLISPVKASGNMANVFEPTISSDGTKMTYVQYENLGEKSNSSLHVKSLITERDTALVSGEEFTWSPTWSPDGKAVAYGVSLPGKNEIRISSVIENETKTIISCPRTSAAQLSWSPDGQTIACCERPTPDSSYRLFLTNIFGGSRRHLTYPPLGSYGDLYPKFSPDGNRLAFIRTTQGQLSGYIMILDLEKENAIPKRISTLHKRIGEIEWIDNENIAFIAKKHNATGIWKISTLSGQVDSMGGQHATTLSISPKTRKLIYSTSSRSVEIHKFPLGSIKGESIIGERIVSAGVIWSSPDISQNGKLLAYISNKVGTPELWICDSSGSNAIQLTYFGNSSLYNPSWSPDGRWIAFEVRHNDSAGIYRISSSGGDPLAMIDDLFDNGSPTWSNDGLNIYFYSDRTGKHEIWKSNVDGSNVTQVTNGGGLICGESPDGLVLYFTRPDSFGIWQMPTVGEGEVKKISTRGGIGSSRIYPLDPGRIFYLDNPPLHSFTLSSVDLYSNESFIELSLGSEEPGFYPLISVSRDRKWMCSTRLLPLQNEVYVAEF